MTRFVLLFLIAMAAGCGAERPYTEYRQEGRLVFTVHGVRDAQPTSYEWLMYDRWMYVGSSSEFSGSGEVHLYEVQAEGHLEHVATITDQGGPWQSSTTGLSLGEVIGRTGDVEQLFGLRGAFLRIVAADLQSRGAKSGPVMASLADAGLVTGQFYSAE